MPRPVEQAIGLLSAARHAVALTGAGISTPSGIPDFRGQRSGLWTEADPMAVASIWAFHDCPEQFYRWIRPLMRKALAAKPNAAHMALAALEQRGLLGAVITQNIDSLHLRAGSRRVLELHGHARTATCLDCHSEHPVRSPLVSRSWRRSASALSPMRRAPEAGRGPVRRTSALRRDQCRAA